MAHVVLDLYAFILKSNFELLLNVLYDCVYCRQFQDKGEDKQDETALTADRTVAEIFTFSTLQRLLVPFVVRPVVGRFLVRPIIRHLLMPAGRFMWRAMFPLGVREFPGLKRIPTQLYPFAKWGANWAAEYVVFAVLRRTAESLIGLVTTTLL